MVCWATAHDSPDGLLSGSLQTAWILPLQPVAAPKLPDLR
jgi:hypothetical protein